MIVYWRILILQNRALCSLVQRDGLSEEILQRADGFLKFHGGFYRKSEYLRFSCDYYSKFDKSIKKTDIDWHLSEEEILVKRLAWAKTLSKTLNVSKHVILRKIQSSLFF
jgi:tRNA (guanosine-2'-O-)-methyltransferase